MTLEMGRAGTERKMVLESVRLTGLDLKDFASEFDIRLDQLNALEAGVTDNAEVLIPRLADGLGLPEGWFRWDHDTVASALVAIEPDQRLDLDLGTFRFGLEKKRFEVWRAVQDGLLTHRQRPTYRAITDNDIASDVAAEVRRSFGLGHQPIRDLANLAEDMGLIVFTLNGPDSPVDGLMAEVEDSGYGVCLINSSGSDVRQRFTLAHEIGHWVGGDAFCKETFGGDQERYMNAFAVHLLLPKYQITEQFDELVQIRGDRDAAIIISAEFGTSWSATLSQLRNLGKITWVRRQDLDEKFPPTQEDYERLGIALPLVRDIPSSSRLFSGHVDEEYLNFPSEWRERYDYLRGVQSGWLGAGEGDSVEPEVLETVGYLLQAFFEQRLIDGGRPGLYPLIEGGAQMEWSDESGDWSVELLNEGGALIYLFGETDFEESVGKGTSSKGLAEEVLHTLGRLKGGDNLG